MLQEKIAYSLDKLGLPESGTISSFADVQRIVMKSSTRLIDEALTKEPTLEGESKAYYRLDGKQIAVAKLKPSIYSFTHKRYGNIDKIDVVRNKIWALLGQIINEEYFNFLKDGKLNRTVLNTDKIKFLMTKLSENKEDLFLSNWLSYIDDNSSLVVFEDEIAENIEIVFKDYFVGTWKHRLLNPELYTTREGINITKESKLPKTLIRFDWRNPVKIDGELSEIPDETIPDDLADLYINVDNAKISALLISEILRLLFESIGLELVDGCYFMNKDGDRIHSEITPDGLRIKVMDNYKDSFDKDLWRQGADKSTLTKKWDELYNKLKSIL